MSTDNRRSWPLVPNEALLLESERHHKDSLLHPGSKHHHNGHHHHHHHHHNGHHHGSHNKHGRHHHHDVHHHHDNHHREGHHRRDEQLNDNQIANDGNNHSEETQSTEGNNLNDAQHSHEVNHRHHRKHGNSLETVDIDSFLSNSNSEPRDRSKTHPLPETTYLDLFNKTELMTNNPEEAKTINSIAGILASNANISTKRANGIPEHSKNGAIDEYSFSELLTSDDSSNRARRSNDTRCNSARSYSSPISSQNGYYSKGTREFLQSKGIKMRDKKLSKVKNPQRGSKEATDSMIATIEKYHKICQLNYEHVEAQINSTFSRLSNSLNFRRKALVEEAKSIRNRKMQALDELKEKCTQAPPTPSNVGSSNGQNDENQNDVDPTEDEENLYQGINEPWGHTDTSNCNDQTKSDSLDQMKSPCVKDNTVSPLQNHGPDGTLSSSRLTLSGELEEGNMTFNFNHEESNIFKEIGCIKENLSSPQFSFTKGLSDVIGIVGDKIDFEVHTRDRFGDVNVNSMDKLLVRIYDSNKKKIPVEDSSTVPKRKSSFSSHVMENKLEPGVYHFSFTPVKAGSHEISVKLNDAELSTSPFKFLVYSKSDLTFTSDLSGRNGEEQSGVNSPPTSISEDDSTDSDDDVFLNIRRDKNWLVHKEGKSSLLRSMSNVPSGIYASQEVNGMCAWQIRVTTACMNIVLSVGVKTCSGIPDLDEQFTCEFRLLSFVETAHTLDKMNHSKCSPRRKSSIFSRLSWTFTVLMNDGIIRVTCHELNEDKRIEINLVNSFSLHPFCSMIHHHNTVPLHVCPRPQLSFL